jgi:hypothetical protein
MRREPDLTFEGALRILGHYEPGWIKKLDTVLDGVILVAGAGLATAAVGPAGLGVLAKFGLVWGWADQKGVAIGLLEKAMKSVSERLAGTRGRERRELIVAAHTTIVVAAVFEAFREGVGKEFYERLKITDEEKKSLISRSLSILTSTSGSQTTMFDYLYAEEVPAPSASCGFEENVPRVKGSQYILITFLNLFIEGLDVAEKARIDWEDIRVKAIERYRSHYLRLAATVPEFALWANLNEHAATRTVIKDMRADISAALDADRNALGRIEALLSLTAPPPGQLPAVPDLRAAVARANRGVLDEAIIPADPQSYGNDITLPSVREIYVNPWYRVAEQNEQTRATDEGWWSELPARDDFDLMLATYVTSPDATRLPMLLLGHPGAGKSLLSKVFAARLPAADYTVVRVPLRRVGTNAPVIEQIQQALDRATNRRVGWWQLADQCGDTVQVVLLDGLDELLQASPYDKTGYLQEVAEFQRRQAEQDRPVAVLVTSRTVVADRVVIPAGTTVVKLEPFTDSDIAAWRERWNRVNAAAIGAGKVRPLTEDTARGQPELTQQPLLLLMLALYVASPGLEPLDGSDLTSAQLYRRLLSGFAQREAAKELARNPDGTPVGGLRRDEVAEQARDQLDRLEIAALGMFNRGRQDISEETLGADLAALDPHSTTHHTTAEAGQRIIGEFFFVHAPETSPLTGAQPGAGAQPLRAYEFLHATFGEYLVAARVMDELVEAADKAVAGRRGRGTTEPDDDLLYVLLSHQALAARRSMLDFAGEIWAELPSAERTRVLEVLELLLGQYRNRHDSGKYAAYRPAPADQVRQLAFYSANLTALRVTLEPYTGVALSQLLREPVQPLEQWRSMVMLWRSGLDADGLRAMARTVVLTTDPYTVTPRYGFSEPDGYFDAFPAATEVSLARLVDDRPMARRLRYGEAITDNNHDFARDSEWAEMMASRLIPLIAGGDSGVLITDPPEGTAESDIIGIAELIFTLLRSGIPDHDRDAALIDLLFDMPQVFKFDELALATAVLNDPDLRKDCPQLKNPRVYGRYADIVNKSISREWRENVSFRNLPDGAIAAIRSILDKQSG